MIQESFEKATEDIRRKIGPLDRLYALVAGASPKRFRKPVNPDDVGVVLFTSGSFAAPRGVVLSQGNLVSNARQVASHIELDTDWVFFNPLPMFHSFGLTGGVMTPILNGLKVFEYPSPLHTKIIPGLVRETGANVLLATDTGLAVRARHVVVAAGYEGQAWLPRAVARNRSSYAFVSDPVAGGIPAALAGTLLWETAHPYLYLRPVGDGRLLVGGEDDRMDIPERRDRRVAGKTDRLLRKASALLPGLGLQPAFAWAGTFAETADALPCFGPHPRYGSRVLFAMAYGGNGITYAMAGAGLLRALAERRRHPLAALFGFARLQP